MIWLKENLGTEETGRRTAEREETARERETVRGTDRARVRSESMMAIEG